MSCGPCLELKGKNLLHEQEGGNQMAIDEHPKCPVYAYVCERGEKESLRKCWIIWKPKLYTKMHFNHL